MKTRFNVCFIVVLGISLLAADAFAQTRPDRRQGRNRQRGQDSGLRVGQEAPTFVLKSLDGESETDLSTFRGEKPVILFFGSYT